ncbi:whi5 like domain-containing [Trichoderma arundinaceum]|uniref:Whi5 like domain-containing n=1 Tax=Trichoderma arundinaceum TaxID=490622 RepID=A0A395NCM6_TRIAR|nr:whi5 like domain-containing [Trichoderma arundinaceum]
MEPSSSPMKRRAVLGSLDANAALSTPISNKTIMIGSSMLLTPSALLVSSPLLEVESAKGKKRVAEGDTEEVVDESPVAKKTCVDGATRSRSPSIETSSLFDTSSGDASWATSTTEPDLIAAATAAVPLATTRPRALTREQAREKAEILRLRLGLAGYKLRTGQTTIPLSELQPKPLPPSTTTRRRANTLGHAAWTNTHNRVRSVDSFPQVPALSQESTTTSVASDAVTIPASQESVIVETRGNTPDHLDAQETGSERDKAILLPIGELDSPSKVFQSSPAPAPVSSLRSTCTDIISAEGDRL